MNILTIVNRFDLHFLHCYKMHLAIITRITTIKLEILKGGGKVEESRFLLQNTFHFLLGKFWKKTRLLVSGQISESFDCPLRSMKH